MEIRPAPYAAPDRAAWTQQHGTVPFVVPAEAAIAAEAMDLLEDDLSTIDASRAEAIGDALDSLCETVGIIEGIDPETVIFFDRTTREFVAYPAAP
jgi:hypothetical protein